MQRRKFHHSNIIKDRWLSCCNTSFSISQKLQDPDSNAGGPGASGFWLGPLSPCKLPIEDTSKAVGCHVIWSILLQMGWGFKIIWYHAMSSWETELERVPLQALPTGREQKSQELNPWLPRPRLVAEPQDHSSPLPAIAPAEGLQDPYHTRTPQAE